MLTWQLDRLLRAGPLCAIASFVIPALLALLVGSVSEVENVVGIVMLAALIIGVGGLVGSVVAVGFGIALFALGSLVAEVPVWLMAIVGVGLFAAFVLHDYAGVFRRGPRISPTVWRTGGVMFLSVAVTSVAFFAVAYPIATLATWQTIVVPFGIAAVGFAAKLGADSHATSTRRLTKKRSSST